MEDKYTFYMNDGLRHLGQSADFILKVSEEENSNDPSCLTVSRITFHYSVIPGREDRALLSRRCVDAVYPVKPLRKRVVVLSRCILRFQ